MYGKEISELNDIEVDDNSLALVYSNTNNQGVGKTFLKNIRDVVGMKSLRAIIRSILPHSEPSVEVTRTDTDYTINLNIPKPNDIKDHSVSENIDENGFRSNDVKITYEDETETKFTVRDGIGIKSHIVEESTDKNGLRKNTVTDTLSDGNEKSYEVKDGIGIKETKVEQKDGDSEISKITLTFTDGTTKEVEVRNGKGIESIEYTPSNVSRGENKFKVKYSDGTESNQFTVLNGKDFRVVHSFKSVEELENSNFKWTDRDEVEHEIEFNDFVMIDTDSVEDEDTGKLYMCADENGEKVWHFIGDISGCKGDTGTLEIGEVTTVEPDEEASVENVGTPQSAILNFKIPKGDKGETGNTATVEVGTVETIEPEESASVENVGDEHNAIFNFKIPKGANNQSVKEVESLPENPINNVYNTQNGKVFSKDVELATKEWILDLIENVRKEERLAAHPKGSLLWTSDPTNPGEYLGGTWVRIKDKFVLAAGDTYKADATGGSATVQLTKPNLPAHDHGMNHHHYTGGTTDGNNRGHTHGMNHHHYWSGSASHHHSVFSQGDHSSRYTGLSFNHTSGSVGFIGAYESSKKGEGWYEKNYQSQQLIQDTTVSLSGWTGDSKTTSNNGVDRTSTDDESQNHTHTWGNWSGDSCTTANNSTVRSKTDPTGSGTAFSILPPYVVKYCFERIA